LDYNATTPIDPEVAEAMRPYQFEHFGNPSSSHWYGIQAKNAVKKARAQVADLLNCAPEEVIFTSGGSESNNYAIKGALLAHMDKGNHIITSAVEHPSVTEVCTYFTAKGFLSTYVPVDEFGLINPHELEKAITPQTILITIMHANNEVGTIQPIAEVAEIARAFGILFHTDAAQSMGKIPTRVDELSVDLLSMAGHKLYAPKGIGALYVKRGVKLQKLIHGGGHEHGLRAGTENILGIVGLGKACEIAKRDLHENMIRMREMRDLLYQKLSERCSGIKLNGHPEKRLPNTLSVSFKDIEAVTLLAETEAVAASAGAACHSDSVKVSSVLEAMGVGLAYAMGTIRFSTGKTTTEEEIHTVAALIVEAADRLGESKK
jgi:cysteine desulfurase